MTLTSFSRQGSQMATRGPEVTIGGRGESWVVDDPPPSQSKLPPRVCSVGQIFWPFWEGQRSECLDESLQIFQQAQ